MAKTAFLFPGQGAQHVGMAKQLVETLPAARQLFDEANDVLGFDLYNVCVHGPAERLNATDISQPAIFVASMCALAQLKHDEPDVFHEVTATAGLSLGEYTSLVFAGVMSFSDALIVVQHRGQAMQAAAEATPSGMISVLGLDLAQVEELACEASMVGTMQVANRLCPGNIVVSGVMAACDKLVSLAESKGARTVRLSVAGAFHTDIMKPADAKLAAVLRNIDFQPARLPVWSNVDAQPHTDPDELKQLLVQQVLSPVLWEESMRQLLDAGIERFYEIGPGRVLAGLIKRVLRKVDIRNISA